MVDFQKKAGPAPRTLKVGEVLRTTFAKRLQQANAVKLRPKRMRMRRCESSIHRRSTVEQAAREGAMETFIVADPNMQNYFNTVEWSAVRA